MKFRKEYVKKVTIIYGKVRYDKFCLILKEKYTYVIKNKYLEVITKSDNLIKQKL